MRQLAVYYNNIKAGLLTEQNNGNGYAFTYNGDYLGSDLPPVSVTFPKRKEPYHSEQMFPFFINMLPEGANRKIICRSFKLDDEDYFGLLTIMADRDFIGAINVRRDMND